MWTLMKNFRYRDKEYRVDSEGFLLYPDEWDEDFAEGMAPEVGITGGLTEAHWRVLRFLRNTFEAMNVCPLVYVACEKNELGLGDLERLFPTGYLRGACRLAGVTYREAYLQNYWLQSNIVHHTKTYERRTYATDAQGFLVNADDWDENYAVHKAFEMKMPDYLTDEHWKIIYFLRNRYRDTGKVPTVFETCEANDLTLADLQRLFPDGYHRGAVKIAGLRAR
jgi:tRNA 2-thiouridine synthesizing protein E